MSNTDVHISGSLDRLRGMALPVGVASAAIGLGLAFALGGTELASQAYLFAFFVWLSIPMGSLALLMVHHMTAGSWSFIIQRLLEAATRTIAWMGVLFIPIFLGPLVGIHPLYEGWMHPDNPLVEAKVGYLNTGFWAIRAVAFFCSWWLISALFNAWSKRLDETNDPLITLKFRRFAPPALIFYCLTMTFAATDWIMSLEPEWFSTMFGPLVWISQVLTTFAFMILILSSLAETKPISRYLTVDHYQQLGTFMLAFTVLWAYMSFSQFLIIWSGNLGEEIEYYTIARLDGGMAVVAVMLMVFHFLIPLIYLLQRKFKFNISRLRLAAWWILAWRLVDLFYHINPAFHHKNPGVHIQDIVVYLLVVLGIGGIWVWLFLSELRKRPLLALNDPRLDNALSHGHGEAEAAEHA